MPSFSKSDQAHRKPPKIAKVRRRQPMRRRSLTNSRAVAWRTEYLKLREAFLEVNDECEMRLPGVCTFKATTVQHMVQVSRDPSKENLLDVHFWKASCWACNAWCATRPKEAEDLGLELSPMARDAIRALQEAA